MSVVNEFVPWFNSERTFVSAINALAPDVACRIRPRLLAGSPLVDDLGALESRVIAYVDVGGDTPLPTMHDFIPVVALSASGAVEHLSELSGRVAVRVSAMRFEDERNLAADLEPLASLDSDCVTVDIIVDVPCTHSRRVTDAIAAGAARRVPHQDRWRDIVVCFRTEPPPRASALAEVSRPNGDRWPHGLSKMVMQGESFGVRDGVIGYPLPDRWIISDASSPSARRLFAEVIVTNPGFGGPDCCAADAWLLAAASDEMHAADNSRWQWAALVHWMTAAVEAGNGARSESLSLSPAARRA